MTKTEKAEIPLYIEQREWTKNVYAAKIDKSHQATSDSGANVSIINSKNVTYVGLERRKTDTPMTIAFANGQKLICHEYVHMGSILNRLIIVDDAPDNLISVGELCDNGYQVIFKQ